MNCFCSKSLKTGLIECTLGGFRAELLEELMNSKSYIFFNEEFLINLHDMRILRKIFSISFRLFKKVTGRVYLFRTYLFVWVRRCTGAS